MFASELSKQNKGTLSPFCLRQGFFEGSGMEKSSCHPTSAYTGVYDFRGPGIKGFSSTPSRPHTVRSVDVGEGKDSGFANMG